MRATSLAFFFGLGLSISIFGVYSYAEAQSSQIQKLQSQISERNDRLAEIEEEIARYEKELQKVGAEKSTLQSAINQLELERKKVQADISYTQNQIGATDLEINKLAIEIDNTIEDVGQNKAAVAETLRRVYESDNDSLIEVLLRHENISEFWVTLEELQTVRGVMGEEVDELLVLKDVLEDKREDSEEKRDDLVALKRQYSSQNEVLTQNKREKDTLLTQTKNKEANYQVLLAEKRAAKEQFERELQELQEQLQFILDPNSIPGAQHGVIAWPVDNVFITQYFGNTPFAKSGAYSGSGHNGVDFGVSQGSKVRTSLSGKVRAVGNTDVGGCYSYGKWILVDHYNGLSTLYAHLSVINVFNGEEVKTGDVIGFSGNTGYSTGPHLHFSLFAREGVEVRNLKKWYQEIGKTPTTACAVAGVSIPVAGLQAYLNPIEYLPNL